MTELPKKEILGIEITDATESEILEYIFASLKDSHEKYYIVTPNPEIVMFARAHPSFKAVLNEARIGLCDGAGLFLAAKILRKQLKARVAGTDLLETLCKNSVKLSKESVRKPVTVGFLGGRKGVALRAAECLIEKYPGLNVSFVSEEWTDEGFLNRENSKIQDPRSKNIDNEEKIINHQSLTINHKHIDILFVAFGFPKQEQFMAEHVGRIPATVMIGVGGAFDYISGNVGRAPGFMRAMGLEWLYRLIRQPWRIKRQLALLKFIAFVISERLHQ